MRAQIDGSENVSIKKDPEIIVRAIFVTQLNKETTNGKQKRFAVAAKYIRLTDFFIDGWIVFMLGKICSSGIKISRQRESKNVFDCLC